MKILIAEDDLTSRAMLTAVLKKTGHEVIETRNGIEAWTELQKPDAPGLVILDWVMPEMDGLEVLRRVRALKIDLPSYIIMLTSKGEKNDIITGLNAGADDYLAKPFDVAELNARLHVGKRTLRLQAEIRRYAQDMEALARERAVQLAHSDRMATLGILSAGIAHEINNPASFISISAQMLAKYWKTIQDSLDGKLSPEQTDKARLIAAEVPALLDEIRSGVKRISHIVNGLKTYSHSDSRKQSGVRVADCVEASLRLCAHRIKYHVSVVNQLPEDLPAVFANSNELEQVFINLFTNAADAIEEIGSGTLTVSGTPEKKGVSIRIKDSGPGFPTDKLNQLFTPFFTTKKIGKGTGLGLSISRNIIEDHGGTLTARNHPDGGAEFCIFLPAE